VNGIETQSRQCKRDFGARKKFSSISRRLPNNFTYRYIVAISHASIPQLTNRY
jgi:hypothetical protein